MKRTLKNLVLPLLSCSIVRVVVRAYCAMGLRAFLLFVRTLPEVQRVFLRRGGVEGGWREGYSDYDLTIELIALPAEEEVAFITRTRTMFALLQRLFPLFGDLRLASASDIALWQEWGPATRMEQRRWAVLYSRGGDRSV